jgi:hypothetical protein
MRTTHRLSQLGLCLFAGMITLVGALLLLPATGEARPSLGPSLLYVAPDGNCGSASPCYGSLQGHFIFAGVTTRSGWVTSLIASVE